MTHDIDHQERRSLLRAVTLFPLAVAGAALSLRLGAQSLPPTPACGGKEQSTPRETEGPFFRPSSPERNSLYERGMSGTRLVVEGQVLTTQCQPVPGALLDFWQADDSGAYDNEGFRLRGHQYSDRNGRYRLETIVPGLYPGRTRHIHVKVQAPSRSVLTTQLYFPGEPRNARDFLYQSRLEMVLLDAPHGKEGQYNFVLAG